MQVVRQGGLWCRAAVPESSGDERRSLARRTIGHLSVGLTAVNIFAGTVVFAYYAFTLDVFDNTSDGSGGGASVGLNAAVAVVFFALCTKFAHWRARHTVPTLTQWRDDPDPPPPTPAQRRELLAAPKQMVITSLINWGLGIPIFFALNLGHGLVIASEFAGGIALSGLIVCAAVYLLAERIMRPAVALALASTDAPPEGRSLSIQVRFLGTWAIVAGVPFIMIALIPIGPVPDNTSDVVMPIWFVAIAAILAGAVTMKLATQAVSRPIRQLRDAMDRVRVGDTDVKVTVDDGSEIGRLQAGFNHMVAGLSERELIRDLFGRQVGDDVARDALEKGVTLGGQTRTVSALFVDVIGSTSLATREPPERVVAILNEFFAAVVDVIGRHDGLVNKFEGDGAMCVFGAPVEREDHATAALKAARELNERLGELRQRGVPLEAAIGVSCGSAVAGHVGAEERYEYTVIGDPVNEAARLRDLAKSRPGRVLASTATVERASAAERELWASDGEARLRGRGAPTGLAVPRSRNEARMSAA